MKILTKEILKRLPKLYATEKIKLEDKEVHVKFFNPCGAQTWYGIEYDGVDTFFGYVDLFGQGDGELGYFSINELMSLKLCAGLKIERDKWFGRCKLSEIINGNVR
jgi:hypothetical protein